MTGVDAGLGFEVTPENVLDAYAVIAAEVQRLTDSLEKYRTRTARGMGLCGGDPVSRDASASFTAAGLQLAAKCKVDVARLDGVAQNLKAIALAYGKTDDQIAGVLKDAYHGYRPEPIVPVAADLPPGHQDAMRGRFR
jgi:uncharacterized protein YukE